jgi:hypothetical protein
MVVDKTEGMTSSSSSSSAENTVVEYQPYEKTQDCMILAQQNAGNISVLKSRLDDSESKISKCEQLKNNVDLMQAQIDALLEQQTQFAQSIAGTEAPDITGL